jgi:peroxiredoxin
MEIVMLLPRQTAPSLVVPTLDHGTFDLATASPSLGTVICFYRGLHCPVCATYLAEFEKLVGAFAERGVESIAISSDGEERARDMANKIDAKSLRFGHSLPLSVARNWSLYISTSRGKSSIGIEEPALFSEPGLFLINADRSIYFLSVQSMPFVRPHFRELLSAVDFAIEKDYPARGEYSGPV